MKHEPTPRKGWGGVVWPCLLIIGLMVLANGLLKDNTPTPAPTKSESKSFTISATQRIALQ